MSPNSSDARAADTPDRTAGRQSWTPVLLLRAAHPRLGVLSALALAVAAVLSGRTPAAAAVVLVTALVGQAILGWHNDLVDRRRDAADEREGKPIAQGLIAGGDVAFVMACAVLVVIPLAISQGLWSGLSYLASLVVGLVGNVVLRHSVLSWLPWAASFALYPAFLSYGGFAGTGRDTPPEISVTVLSALLGVCVHFLVSLPGLVLDHENGRSHLPLRIALRIGAPRLLWATIAVTALVLGGLLAVGSQVGLRQ